MTQPISDQYFYSGPFASAGPELFASYTCLGCGVRLKTWNTFDAHRRDCSGRLSATGAVFGSGLMDRLLALGTDESAVPAGVDQPRVAGAAPLSLMPAALSPLSPLSPASAGVGQADLPPAEHDPFLDAPPAALVLLERWRREEEQQVRRDAA